MSRAAPRWAPRCAARISVLGLGDSPHERLPTSAYTVGTDDNSRGPWAVEVGAVRAPSSTPTSRSAAAGAVRTPVKPLLRLHGEAVCGVDVAPRTFSSTFSRPVETNGRCAARGARRPHHAGDIGARRLAPAMRFRFAHRACGGSTHASSRNPPGRAAYGCTTSSRPTTVRIGTPSLAEPGRKITCDHEDSLKHSLPHRQRAGIATRRPPAHPQASRPPAGLSHRQRAASPPAAARARIGRYHQAQLSRADHDRAITTRWSLVPITSGFATALRSPAQTMAGHHHAQVPCADNERASSRTGLSCRPRAGITTRWSAARQRAGTTTRRSSSNDSAGCLAGSGHLARWAQPEQ